MNKEFREYIRLLISEILNENPSVHSKLFSRDGKDEEEDLDEEDKLGEFSGVGAIQRFALPLGTSPDMPISGSKKRKKSKKRKNPSWS